MFCDHVVHIEQALIIRAVDELRNERIIRGTKSLVGSAKPLEIAVTRGDKGLCPLGLKIIRDGAAFVVLTCRQRMTFRYREVFEPILTKMAAKRVKPANQWSVRMHFTPLRTKEYASAVLLLPQGRALAVDGPCFPKLSCAFAFRTSEACDLIGVELNVFVLTTTGAASANVAERCVGRRNGGPIHHQSTPTLVCVSRDRPVVKVLPPLFSGGQGYKCQSGTPMSALGSFSDLSGT